MIDDEDKKQLAGDIQSLQLLRKLLTEDPVIKQKLDNAGFNATSVSAVMACAMRGLHLLEVSALPEPPVLGFVLVTSMPMHPKLTERMHRALAERYGEGVMMMALPPGSKLMSLDTQTMEDNGWVRRQDG